MRLRVPTTIGESSGWMMLAFVFGVAGHSFYPEWHLVQLHWMVIIFVLVMGRVVVSDSKKRIVLFLVAALLFGFWRVDISSMPRLRWIDGVPFRIAEQRTETWPWSTLQAWRVFMTKRIATILPPDDAALVTGILYGDGKLSKESKELFRSAGLMHIIAVSGSNVTVIVQFFALVFAHVGLRRRQTFGVTTLALCGFVGFVGFSASVVRAACMSWLALVAREVGRLPTATRLLLVVASFLLLIDPWALRFDIGFGLSFLAMWGILVWSPLFARWLRFLPERFMVRESVSMTFAATLTTAPYLAWIFHRVSLIGLATNVLVLPLVPWVMLWGAVMAVWGNGPLSSIFSLSVLGCTRLILWVASLSYRLPWFDRRALYIGTPLVVALYVVIVYLGIILREKPASERP